MATGESVERREEEEEEMKRDEKESKQSGHDRSDCIRENSATQAFGTGSLSKVLPVGGSSRRPDKPVPRSLRSTEYGFIYLFWKGIGREKGRDENDRRVGSQPRPSQHVTAEAFRTELICAAYRKSP